MATTPIEELNETMKKVLEAMQKGQRSGNGGSNYWGFPTRADFKAEGLAEEMWRGENYARRHNFDSGSYVDKHGHVYDYDKNTNTVSENKAKTKQIEDKLNMSNLVYSKTMASVAAWDQAIKSIAQFANATIDAWYNMAIISQRFIQQANSIFISTYGSNVMQKTLANGLKSIGGDLMQSKYEAANNSIDANQAHVNANLDMNMAELKFQHDYLREHVKVGEAGVGAIVATTAAVGALAGSVVPGVGNVAGAAIGAMTGLVASGFKEVLGIAKNWYLKSLELDEEELKTVTEERKAFNEQMSSYVKQFLEFSSAREKELQKSDEVGKQIAVGFGMIGPQMQQYANVFVSSMLPTLAKYGIKAEDFQKMQSSIQDATGRNVMIGVDEATMTKALSKQGGTSQEEMASLMGKLNQFNISFKDGRDSLAKMYVSANKMGISTSKYSKELIKNLSLAEKYHFKDGVEGLERMSKWAMKVRFNMESLSPVMDKFGSGNINDVIESSAQLQVLGGNFAALSDPIGMMYDALNDAESMGERIANMAKGRGTFNVNTGQLEFGGTDQILMKTAAQTLGIDYASFLNSAREQDRRSRVNKVIGGRVFSNNKEENDYIKDMLGSKAAWNNIKKQWEVGVLTSGGIVQKNVSDITAEDIRNMSSNDAQTDSLAYLEKTFNVTEQMNNATQFIAMSIGGKVYQNFLKSNQEVTKKYSEKMGQNMDLLATKTQEGIEASGELFLQKQDELIDIMNTNLMEGYLGEVSENTASIHQQVVNIAQRLGAQLEGGTSEAISGMAATMANGNYDTARKQTKAVFSAGEGEDLIDNIQQEMGYARSRRNIKWVNNEDAGDWRGLLSSTMDGGLAVDVEKAKQMKKGNYWESAIKRAVKNSPGWVYDEQNKVIRPVASNDPTKVADIDAHRPSQSGDVFIPSNGEKKYVISGNSVYGLNPRDNVSASDSGAPKGAGSVETINHVHSGNMTIRVDAPAGVDTSALTRVLNSNEFLTSIWESISTMNEKVRDGGRSRIAPNRLIVGK